jgi:hypothetical protein
MKPRRPVASPAGTVSSGAITSLVAWLTALEIQLKHVNDKFVAVEWSLPATAL